MLMANKGVSSLVLSKYILPPKVGDPLGLRANNRPLPPSDPDTHDIKNEDENYTRSFLNVNEKNDIDSEIKKDGYLSIDQVREMITENSIKNSIETTTIDPEIIAYIDPRINYKIFIAADNVYTREELYTHYPFHELNVQPEAIFIQQELGIFISSDKKKDEFEYVARDMGDESVEFTMVDDLVKIETKKGYNKVRTPQKIAKTKIYIGKEMWEDFRILHKFFRGAIRVSTAQLAYSSSTPLFALPHLNSLDTTNSNNLDRVGSNNLDMAKTNISVDDLQTTFLEYQKVTNEKIEQLEKKIKTLCNKNS